MITLFFTGILYENTGMQTPQRQTWIKDILLLMLCIGFLYSLFLGIRPLSPPDEARYSEIPREMVASSDYITPHLNGVKYFEKPVLFYWLQSFTIKLLGINEWSLRSVNAFMGILGCLLTYWGARVLYDRKSALLATLILSTSLLYLALANFITLDMTVSVFLTASLFCFLIGNRYPPGNIRRYFMWSMFAFAGLATLTKGLIGILFPGMVIFIWLCLTRQWHHLKSYCLLSGSLLFLAITLPWHILVQLKNPEFFHFYFIEQHFLRYLTDYASRTKPKWFLPTILALGFFPWTGFLGSALKENLAVLKDPKRYSTEIFLIVWFAFIFVFYWFSKSQLSPYILPLFPPLAVLTGRFIHTNWHRPGKLKFGYYFALIVSSFLSISILIYTHFIMQQPNSWINIAAFLPLIFAGSLISYRRQQLKLALFFLSLSSFYMLTIGTFSFEMFDNRSVKPLALELADIIGPKDKIYNFNNYHQDLPFYLKRKINIINWTGELKFGKEHSDNKNQFLHENNFMQEWPSEGRKFLLLKNRDLNYLKTKLNLHFFVIDMNKDYALICNQEVNK